VTNGEQAVSWTVIASTGDRFADFAPYVASVNDDGTVAFQAALAGGGAGVFTGREGEVAEVVGRQAVADVTSHPDITAAGEASFYGAPLERGEAVFLTGRNGLRRLAETGSGAFASIGPLGPTMNEVGGVAFRAEREAGVSGIFLAEGGEVATVAESGGRWNGFEGLPVVTARTVVFRADRTDGGQGIYAARAGSIQTVVETDDDFAELGRFPSAEERGTVAFSATLRAGGSGVFVADDGRITRVIDTDGEFEAFRGALIAGGGSLVLIATPRGGRLGLFSGPDARRDRLLAVGDSLYGSEVADFAANPVSVSAAGRVAVRVSLADGRQLIVRADPPLPQSHPFGWLPGG
jgi:hypothetical protein